MRATSIGAVPQVTASLLPFCFSNFPNNSSAALRTPMLLQTLSSLIANNPWPTILVASLYIACE